MTQWWDRLPSAARWASGIAYFLAFYIGFRVYLENGDAGASRFVVVLVGSLALLVVGIAVQARRLGGWTQWQMYRKAYSSGTVPEGARTERWLPIARRNARLFREGVWVQRVWLGLLALLGVILVVLTLVAADGANKLWALAIAVAFGLAGWGVDKLWRWRRDQFARLLPALEHAAQRDGSTANG